jgi:hypothetical protein
MGALLRKMAIYSNIAAQSWSLLLQISSALGARASEIFTNGCATPARQLNWLVGKSNLLCPGYPPI